MFIGNLHIIAFWVMDVLAACCKGYYDLRVLLIELGTRHDDGKTRFCGFGVGILNVCAYDMSGRW